MSFSLTLMKKKYCRIRVLLFKFLVSLTNLLDTNLDRCVFILFIIKVLFSISVTQFSFTLSATNQRTTHPNPKWKTVYYEMFFCTELWALIFVFFAQDLPFLIMRFYIILYFGVEKNYLLYFLLVKNVFLVFFGLYFGSKIVMEEIKAIKKRTKKASLILKPINL